MPPGWAPVSREDRLIYSAPLTGPFYAADNNSTYRIVEKWTIGSEAFIYVRPFKDSQDGRGAMQALRLHYNRPGTVAKRLAKAKSDMDNIHYKSEQHMPFESYINKLNEIFFHHARASEPIYPRAQVELMLQKINTSNPQLIAAVTNISMDDTLKLSPEGYFIAASNKLAEKIAVIFPKTYNQKGSRYVSSASKGGRGGGRGRGMGRGRGDNKTSTFPANLGGKPGDKWKGVDISDLTKQYPEAVFRSFPGPLKKKIHEAKQRARRSDITDCSISELSTQMGQI
jgi:hypothetical protein